MSVGRLLKKRIVSLFMHVGGALCLSCILLVFMAQEDSWVKQQLTSVMLNYITEFAHVPVTGDLVLIDILKGTFVFDNITLNKNAQDQWSFSCPRTVFTVSWLDFLKYGLFSVDVTCYKPQVYSCIQQDNTLCIVEFLRTSMQASAVIPCVMRKCFFSHATAHIVAPDTAGLQSLVGLKSFSCLFSTQITICGLLMRILCDYSEGTLRSTEKNKNSKLEKCSGTAIFDINTGTQTLIKLITHNSLGVCVADKLRYYRLTGLYKDAQGYAELRALNQQRVLCKVMHITCSNAGVYRGIVRAQGDIVELIEQLTSHLFSHLFSPVQNIKNIPGTFQTQLAFAYTPATGKILYTGTLRVADIQVPLLPGMSTIVTTLYGNTRAVQAYSKFSSSVNSNSIVNNIVEGNLKIQWQPFVSNINIQLTQPIVLSKSLSLERATCSSTLEYNSAANNTNNTLSIHNVRYKSNYKLYVVNKSAKVEQKYTLAGSCEGDGNKGITQIVVSTPTNTLEGKAYYTPWPFNLEKVTFEPFIEFMYNAHTEALEATLESKTIKLLAAHWGYEVQGEGKVKLALTKKDQKIVLTAVLEQASMRLKGLYTMVKAGVVNLEVDTGLKAVLCKDSTLELQKGSLGIKRATLVLENGTCVSAHIPVVFNNCLVSWQKDFFGTFSGALVGEYSQEREKSIKGFVSLDQSHLRSNVLSVQVQQQLLSGVRRQNMGLLDQVQLALIIRNSEPIYIKTPVLESKARIALDVQGTLVSPQVSGIIELLQGILLFAYKPLYITHARLYLTPGQLDNALVELTARNKIKKYTVTLQASGPVLQPIISLQASPSLHEEQIITLLLAGSEEGSLYAVMPAMITHTLENFLFSAQQEPSHIQRSLKLLLQPLKHVRIRPDSTGPPGSFKGGVEVDLTENLRASVQSKLYTPQDTQVEIEYTVSDDVSVKGVKDERGMLSGEIEMRWKF